MAKDGAVLITNTIEGLENSKALVRIYDITGSLKSEKEYTINPENSFTLPVYALSGGAYIIELKMENFSSQFQKLIIERQE